MAQGSLVTARRCRVIRGRGSFAKPDTRCLSAPPFFRSASLAEGDALLVLTASAVQPQQPPYQARLRDAAHRIPLRQYLVKLDAVAVDPYKPVSCSSSFRSVYLQDGVVRNTALSSGGRVKSLSKTLETLLLPGVFGLCKFSQLLRQRIVLLFDLSASPGRAATRASPPRQSFTWSPDSRTGSSPSIWLYTDAKQLLFPAFGVSFVSSSLGRLFHVTRRPVASRRRPRFPSSNGS